MEVLPSTHPKGIIYTCFGSSISTQLVLILNVLVEKTGVNFTGGDFF
jgi:hypothetical protein